MGMLDHLKAGPLTAERRPRMSVGTLEESTGPLPRSYAEYLDEYPFTVFFDVSIKVQADEAPPRSPGGRPSVELMFGLEDDRYCLLKAWDDYGDRLPPDVLPIGEGCGGDLICLNVKNEIVSYWQHDGTDHERFNLYKICDGFPKFVTRMEVEDEDELADDVVIGGWIADDLKD